ncbi:hypothetical protein FHS27_006170 [Rhodopirellula rubra]|uniref:tRNA-uridine aminocarboxypropyltransferase n=1 Tax=Aporhodopirellula rubra TaxID=980271 RepID=A0A7W5H999_9BACT|nr:tRNA-uridine aminocarboxypropyltransferase [Aporhodopirellula rubra]MBB3210323.1 hypothetical protein [Aporhodopirellula rubra]
MTPPLQRCLRCYRPHRMCFCDAIVPVRNQTSVLILQHRRERFHPFNTARIVHESLERCDLMVAYNAELADQFQQAALPENTGLLYPGADARLLSDLPPSDRPEHLVILDGTWHQAKTLFRDIPRLQTLPQYCLAPSSPGRYRIRREPNEHALSTLEATVSALMALEPENSELPLLIDAFDRMIGDQLGRHAPTVDEPPKTNWRRNEKRRRGSANVPRVLGGDLNRVVVAYGERDNHRPTPIYWTAVRLGTGERFECAIESDSYDESQFMDHLQLDQQVIERAIRLDEFRNAWRAFLEPGDHIAMRHHGTARLLAEADAEFAPTVILKAVNAPGARMDDRDKPIPPGRSRASVRLQAAVDFVRQLNSLSQIVDPQSVAPV